MPVQDVTMDECVECANQFATALSETLHVPGGSCMYMWMCQVLLACRSTRLVFLINCAEKEKSEAYFSYRVIIVMNDENWLCIMRVKSLGMCQHMFG